jgi:Domain of unknown function (DUF4251)
MKTQVLCIALILCFFAMPGFAQEKTKKQLKEEKKLEKQKQIEELVNAKTFVFNARTALPQGYKSINISTSSYFMRFSPEMILSELPYYGRAYSGSGYGGESGIKFEAKPDEFKIEKGKKNYNISAVVKANNDSYRISLTLGFEGSGTLNVTSNNRSSISYQGEVVAAPVKTEGKE